MGRRVHQLLASRYAKIISYESDDFPLPDFARENGDATPWQTFGMFRAELSQNRKNLRSEEVMSVTQARELLNLFPKGSYVFREPMAKLPEDDAAAASAPCVDEMVRKAVKDQIQSILNTPGAAQQFLRENAAEKRAKKPASRAAANPLKRDKPIEVVVLNSEEEGNNDPLQELRGPSPPIEQEQMNQLGVHLPPMNDPALGSSFVIKGIAPPIVNFLNPSQLTPSQQGVPVASETSPHSVPTSSAQMNQPVVAQPGAAPIAALAPVPRRRKNDDRSSSRGRKVSHPHAGSSSRESSRDSKRDFPALGQPLHPAKSSAATPVKTPNPKRKRAVASVPQPMTDSEPTQQSSTDIKIEDRPNAGYSALLDEVERISSMPRK